MSGVSDSTSLHLRNGCCQIVRAATVFLIPWLQNRILITGLCHTWCHSVWQDFWYDLHLSNSLQSSVQEECCYKVFWQHLELLLQSWITLHYCISTQPERERKYCSHWLTFMTVTNINFAPLTEEQDRTFFEKLDKTKGAHMHVHQNLKHSTVTVQFWYMYTHGQIIFILHEILQLLNMQLS